MLRNAVGGGSVSNFPEKDVTNVFNIISVTRGRVDVNFPEKKHFVTLEWPLTDIMISLIDQWLSQVGYNHNVN